MWTDMEAVTIDQMNVINVNMMDIIYMNMMLYDTYIIYIIFYTKTYVINKNNEMNIIN